MLAAQSTLEDNRTFILYKDIAKKIEFNFPLVLQILNSVLIFSFICTLLFDITSISKNILNKNISA